MILGDGAGGIKISRGRPQYHLPACPGTFTGSYPSTIFRTYGAGGAGPSTICRPVPALSRGATPVKYRVRFTVLGPGSKCQRSEIRSQKVSYQKSPVKFAPGNNGDNKIISFSVFSESKGRVVSIAHGLELEAELST